MRNETAEQPSGKSAARPGTARSGVLEESLCCGRQAQGKKGHRQARRASQKARMTAHEV